MKKINAVIIMDGFAFNEKPEQSAIARCGIPKLSALMNEYPHTTLSASGMSVGLPDGYMGNSEVGHLNIGAGRIIYQNFTAINKAIKNGVFLKNEAFLAAIKNAKANEKKLHLLGLISDGGVHSHNSHLYELVKLCKKEGLTEVYLHLFTDGRDVLPNSGLGFIKELQAFLEKVGTGKIASISGRYFAMDRDNNWQRTQKAYDTLVFGGGTTGAGGADATATGAGNGATDDKGITVAAFKGAGAAMADGSTGGVTAADAAIAGGKGAPIASDPLRLIEQSYKKGVYDEFIEPCNIAKKGEPPVLIREGDSVIFFNFRSDRARQLTRALTQPKFTQFPTKKLNLCFVAMTRYDATFKNILTAFGPINFDNTLGRYISDLGLMQLRIAETEKYAHVTFFFNGGIEVPNKNEDRILVLSPKVETYDLKPEMSAYEVTDKVIEAINSDRYDLLILNFANCDMVGHTGNFDATVKAVGTVDDCADRVARRILQRGGNALITADHGNADQMLDESGRDITSHTKNPVPFILLSDAYKNARLRTDGVLADVAPTLLEVMGLKIPKEMTGKSLIRK
jgi:2,3-bisphosphoglycerate-independent phosphoglycerate mutase